MYSEIMKPLTRSLFFPPDKPPSTTSSLRFFCPPLARRRPFPYLSLGNDITKPRDGRNKALD